MKVENTRLSYCLTFIAVIFWLVFCTNTSGTVLYDAHYIYNDTNFIEYIVSDESTSFEDAQKFCSTRFMHVLLPVTTSENDFVREFVQKFFSSHKQRTERRESHRADSGADRAVSGADHADSGADPGVWLNVIKKFDSMVYTKYGAFESPGEAHLTYENWRFKPDVTTNPDFTGYVYMKEDGKWYELVLTATNNIHVVVCQRSRASQEIVRNETGVITDVTVILNPSGIADNTEMTTSSSLPHEEASSRGIGSLKLTIVTVAFVFLFFAMFAICIYVYFRRKLQRRHRLILVEHDDL